MRKTIILVLFSILFSAPLPAQIIYSENFGVINGPLNSNIAVPLYTGYQNLNVNYSSGSINSRTSVNISGYIPSVGYFGASGGAYVYLEPPIRVNLSAISSNYFMVEGIDTSQHTNIQLTFGYGIPIYRVNGVNYDITVEVSEDGVQWSALQFSRNPLLSPPTGNTWQLASPVGNIPSTNNLRLRFSNTSQENDFTTYLLLIDDIQLTGKEKSMSREDDLGIQSVKIYPNPITDGILNIDNVDLNHTTIELYDMTGKKVFNSLLSTNYVNLSTLKPGVYIVKVKELDKISTQKVFIR